MSVNEHVIAPVMWMGQSIVFLVVGRERIYMSFFAKGGKDGKSDDWGIKSDAPSHVG